MLNGLQLLPIGYRTNTVYQFIILLCETTKKPRKKPAFVQCVRFI